MGLPHSITDAARRTIDRARSHVGRAAGRAQPAAGRAQPAAGRASEWVRVHLPTTRERLVAAVGLTVVVAVVAAVLADGEGPPVGSVAGPEGGPRDGSGLPASVSESLEDMSVRRKVAQLMLVGLEGTGADDPVFDSLEDMDHAGLVIADRNYVSAGQVEELADEAVSTAEEADHVTPLVMTSQEGGEFNALADLPPEDPPAELASPREAESAAENTAEALEDAGITGLLGPVLDVGAEAGGALGERPYSDEPDAVREYGLTTLRAFRSAGLFTAAKHFPGLGGASQSPELGAANVGLSIDQLAERDLIPFEAAIRSEVPGILVGHGLYSVDDFVTPASMSRTIMTGLLRDDLGFEGVAIADDMTSPAVTAAFTPAEAAVDSVRSGADMVYVSVDDKQQQAVFDALLEAVRAEDISSERLDEAVTRTLVAKEAAGLLEAPGEAPGGDGGKPSGGRGG